MTRWTRRLLIGAIAILVPTLAGCEAGLNAPTLEFHPASYGVSTVVNGITLDNLFVLGPTLNETLPAGGQAGVFLALSAQDNDQLVKVTAPQNASSVQLLGGPITLNAGNVVDLSGPHPLIVYLRAMTGPAAQDRLAGEISEGSVKPDSAVVAGDAPAIAAAVGSWAQAGADTVVLHPPADEPDPAAFVRFIADHVRPLFPF